VDIFVEKFTHLNESKPHNNRMQPDFGKLRLPQPLMQGVRRLSSFANFFLKRENQHYLLRGDEKMGAYVLAQIQIDDLEEYQNYLAGFMPIFERHGGELLATSKNRTIVVEGSWAYPSTVIMKFPSVEAAQSWCDDPDYKTLAEHRHRSAQANLVIVEGMA